MAELRESYRRDWEIRRRVKGTKEWHHFATLDPDLWWMEVQELLEGVRQRNFVPNTEYAVFEVITKRTETRRDW